MGIGSITFLIREYFQIQTADKAFTRNSFEIAYDLQFIVDKSTVHFTKT